jgi:hypothetical protein
LVIRSPVRNLLQKRFAIFLDLKAGAYSSSATHIRIAMSNRSQLINWVINHMPTMEPSNRICASRNHQAFPPVSQVIMQRFPVSPLRTRIRT